MSKTYVTTKKGAACLILLGSLMCGCNADYGDAPDGSAGMDTGYYGYSGSGFGFYYLVPLGIPAAFPTIDANGGPYADDADDFFFGGPGSEEADAIDPADPDGIPNLNLALGTADLDTDDGLSVLVIFIVGVPPPALFLTFVTSTVATNAYWNVAIDLDQSGAWGRGNGSSRTGGSTWHPE